MNRNYSTFLSKQHISLWRPQKINKANIQYIKTSQLSKNRGVKNMFLADQIWYLYFYMLFFWISMDEKHFAFVLLISRVATSHWKILWFLCFFCLEWIIFILLLRIYQNYQVSVGFFIYFFISIILCFLYYFVCSPSLLFSFSMIWQSNSHNN